MDFETARNQMLGQQIRTWDVLDDRVLRVLRETRRELFVPEADRDLAFADIEIPLPHGQSMMNPKVEARLLQELAVEPLDEVLEIGTGSGYMATCLSGLGRRVTSLEIHADLSAQAAKNLDAQRIDNVELVVADALGWAPAGKFDAIAVTASMPVLTDHFIGMLRPHGRLFIVIGRPPIMEARLITMHAPGQWTQRSLFETLLTPMINAETSQPFEL
jgi:protein-L-isoaspartate(D-aspartate) O-methyltransferase